MEADSDYDYVYLTLSGEFSRALKPARVLGSRHGLKWRLFLVLSEREKIVASFGSVLRHLLSV